MDLEREFDEDVLIAKIGFLEAVQIQLVVGMRNGVAGVITYLSVVNFPSR